MSATHTELVSVIVPTYERAAFVGHAIESICAQGDERVEIVVVDDGSSDGTAEAVRATGVSVVYLAGDHAGVSAARNRGIRAAHGELIAFLDSDDTWPAGSLAKRRAHLASNPCIEVVYGRTAIVYEQQVNRRFGPYGENRPIEHAMLGSMLSRRSVFDRIGLFDEALEHAEDVEWLARAKGKQVPMASIDDVTLEYRIHGANMSLDVDRNQSFLLRALKRTLEQRRA